ncbi:MAG: DUF3568 family protein [Lentisphaeria bacterium]|jgi:hypothetical protein|nr:DUF3568 family protein [Lentisphaeria bacterium]MDY0176006.1 DUF3568 family protein [Lentisphaeria bacterium]NLZ60626.1 DUF3568 family protein [Lentisphaerota bacterium]
MYKPGFIPTLLLVVSLVFLGACVSKTTAPSHNVSNERFLFGSYSAVLASNLFDTDKAIRATASRAKLIEEARRNKYNNIEYVYRDFYGNKVLFKLWETEDKQSKIEIKVGKLGDKRSSQELLVAIDEELRASGR